MKELEGYDQFNIVQMKMIINDSSILSVSKQPKNVICSTFKDGNIFERSEEWDMILNSQCDDFLASGLLQYPLSLGKKESFSIVIKIQHSNTFITPLAYPISKINQLFLSKTPQFNEPLISDIAEDTPTSLKTLPTLYQKTPLMIQYFLLNSQKNNAIYSHDSLLFTLETFFRLNATKHINQLLTQYENRPEVFIGHSFLSPQQALLLNHINIIDLIHQYRFDAPSITGQLIIKAQKSIASDAFCHFIKKLSIKKFKYHITNDNNVLFIAKLISFLFITNKLEQHKLKTYQSSECQSSCADYLKIILIMNIA